MLILLLLLLLNTEAVQEAIAAEEGGHSNQCQVPQRLEHVLVEPIARVETKNGAQSDVETWKNQF